jgi:hypothetical protein
LKSRLTTIVLVLGLLAFGAAGSFAAVGQLSSAGHHHHHAKKAKKSMRHHSALHKHRVRHAAPTSGAAAPGSSGESDEGGGRSAAGHEYGTRPGKGCGDKNHTHTGPPGNPGNTSCPHH